MHVFITMRTRDYEQGLKELQTCGVWNLRLVEHDYSTKTSIVEGDTNFVQGIPKNYSVIGSVGFDRPMFR